MEHIFLRIPLLTRCFANADSQKMVNDFSSNVFVTFHAVSYTHLDVYKRQMADSKGTGTASVSVAGRMNAFEDFVRVQSDAAPVSYTHLDVYKRQGIHRIGRVNN